MVAANSESFIGLQFARFDQDLALARSNAKAKLEELEERIDYAMLLGRWVLGLISKLPFRDESIQAAEVLQAHLMQWLHSVKKLFEEMETFRASNQAPKNETAFRAVVLDARICVAESMRELYEQAKRIEKVGHIDCVTTEELRLELRSRVGA